MFQQILRADWSLQACRLSNWWRLGAVGGMGQVLKYHDADADADADAGGGADADAQDAGWRDADADPGASKIVSTIQPQPIQPRLSEQEGGIPSTSLFKNIFSMELLMLRMISIIKWSSDL